MTRIALFSAVRCCVFPVFILGVLSLAPSVVGADDQAERAVARAHRFLTTPARMKDVLGHVHLGATLNDVVYAKTLPIERNNSVVPGHFGLVYRYTWNGDGWTDIAFLCDASGDVYEVQALRSNGIIQKPFVLANASIKLLGELLMAAFHDQMSADDRATARTLIDNADAKGLLELSLRLQQMLGG